MFIFDFDGVITEPTFSGEDGRFFEYVRTQLGRYPPRERMGNLRQRQLEERMAHTRKAGQPPVVRPQL